MIEFTDSTGELWAALAAARKEFPDIEKNAENPFFQAKFADYNSIREAVDPVLDKHGLLISQFPSTNSQGDPALTTVVVHVPSAQGVTATAALSLSKKDPQAQGSAITYMKRYSYNAILGLRNVDEDDDGNVAAQPDSKVTRGGKVADGGKASVGVVKQRQELEQAAQSAGKTKAQLAKWYHNKFGKDYKADTDEHNLAAALVEVAK